MLGDSNGLCFDAKAVNGVYGVRGGSPAVVGASWPRRGKGVTGKSGECGAESAPGKMV